MKKMKCNQLGGPETCDYILEAETWEEMQEVSRKHAMENMESHKAAMDEMVKMMAEPEKMQAWMDQKKAEFETL